MRYLLYGAAALLSLVYLSGCGKAQAASGDRTPATLAAYSSNKVNPCVRGSMAHSKTRIFICWSTGMWKKANVQ